MDPVLVRLGLVVLLVAIVVVGGRWWRDRDGHLAPSAELLDPAALERLGVSGPGLVGVLLTSASCSSCEAAKGVLTAVARDRPTFDWLAADVSEHLDVVAALRVLRAPTLLVLGPGGTVLARTSGVPRADELLRVIDTAAPPSARRHRAPSRTARRAPARTVGLVRPTGT
jgi:hypothetical protein